MENILIYNYNSDLEMLLLQYDTGNQSDGHNICLSYQKIFHSVVALSGT